MKLSYQNSSARAPGASVSNASYGTAALCGALLCIYACGGDSKPPASMDKVSSIAGMGALSSSATAPVTARAGGAAPVGATNTNTNAVGAGGARASVPSSVAGGAPSGAAGKPMSSATTAGASAAGAAAAAGATAAAAAGTSAPPQPSAACNAADKKPDPTATSFTKIQGYQQLMKAPTTGPSKPVMETDPGLKDWTVYRPETLSDESLHPVLAWANGGCLRNGTLYGPWLLELASYGYIVLADGPPTEPGSDPLGAGMRAGTDKAQITAIDWLIAENDRACSQYYHTVDVTKLAVAGQSCGGLMSLTAATDKRITTSVIGNSGLFAADQSIYSGLHSPVIYLIGGMNDMAYQNAERDYMNINNVPIFYGNMDTGHGGTWNATNGGEFGRVGLAWLNWQLKGDMTAKKLFVGSDCELCKPPSKWTVKKKMLD